MSNAILQNPRTCAHTVHTLKECFWFLPQVVGLIYLGGWQCIPGICLVYIPQFGLSIYRPYIQRFARNYFLLISTSSLKNSRTGAHFYPNRKTGKKYKWANALVPPTPIWRAMVIRCYAMLSYMFPYLSCLSMIFTRILGNSPEQPPIRIITLFPCRGLVNPEHDPWKSRPKTPPSFAYPLNGVWRHGQALAQGCRTNPRQA